jgi:hypothetical protein
MEVKLWKLEKYSKTAILALQPDGGRGMGLACIASVGRIFMAKRVNRNCAR